MEESDNFIVKMDSQYRVTFPRKWIHAHKVTPGTYIAIKPKVIEMANVKFCTDESDSDELKQEPEDAKKRKKRD